MNEETRHHVVWADRIGLNKQWERDVQACSETFETKEYGSMVKRFQYNIPNIHNGPSLSNIIEAYKTNELDVFKKEALKGWKKANPYINSLEQINEEEEEIQAEAYKMLYTFIIQTLEENGFGFYDKKIDTDSMD